MNKRACATGRFILPIMLNGLAALTLLAAPDLYAAGIAGPRVRLGVVNWIGYGPIYCAATNGYYKKYGYDVKLVTFSDNSLMAGAVEGNEIEATTLTYDQVLTSNAKGWKLKVVMPVDYSVGGDAVLATAAIHTVKDLKNHKVAFQPLSPSDFLLGYVLSGRSTRLPRAWSPSWPARRWTPVSPTSPVYPPFRNSATASSFMCSFPRAMPRG
jgi:NitT/TauT family transport system substrate-binding protein